MDKATIKLFLLTCCLWVIVALQGVLGMLSEWRAKRHTHNKTNSGEDT